MLQPVRVYMYKQSPFCYMALIECIIYNLRDFVNGYASLIYCKLRLVQRVCRVGGCAAELR